MNILILEASGQRKGSSALLASEFARGAEEAGHTVVREALATKDIRPCLGCQYCHGRGNGTCVHKDFYAQTLRQELTDADMVVFALPIYYYGWPAQAKLPVDRFYSHNEEMRSAHKGSALLIVAYDDTPSSFEASELYYDKLCDYMNFEDKGRVVGLGCGTPDVTAASEYPRQAFELGRSL